MPMANLGDVEDAKEFPLIPAGEYICKVEVIKEKMSGAGNKVWRIQLNITEGDWMGSNIFDNLTWSAGTLPRIKNFFRAIEYDVEKKEDVEYIPDMAIGKLVRVVAKVEKGEYKGKATEQTRVEFARYGRIEDGPMSEGEEPVEPGASLNEDDIPF